MEGPIIEVLCNPQWEGPDKWSWLHKRAIDVRHLAGIKEWPGMKGWTEISLAGSGSWDVIQADYGELLELWLRYRGH